MNSSAQVATALHALTAADSAARMARNAVTLALRQDPRAALTNAAFMRHIVRSIPQGRDVAPSQDAHLLRHSLDTAYRTVIGKTYNHFVYGEPSITLHLMLDGEKATENFRRTCSEVADFITRAAFSVLPTQNSLNLIMARYVDGDEARQEKYIIRPDATTIRFLARGSDWKEYKTYPTLYDAFRESFTYDMNEVAL